MNLYFAIENLALNATQRDTLIDALKLIGAPGKTRPCDICHWRIRPDDQAAIFEADFPVANLTLAALKNYMSNVFGVAPATITHTITTTIYGPRVTLGRGGTDYVNVYQFGGATATLLESRAAVSAFIKDHPEWEPPVT